MNNKPLKGQKLLNYLKKNTVEIRALVVMRQLQFQFLIGEFIYTISYDGWNRSGGRENFLGWINLKKEYYEWVIDAYHEKISNSQDILEKIYKFIEETLEKHPNRQHLLTFQINN